MWHVCKGGQDESPSDKDVQRCCASKRRKKQTVAKRHEQMKKDFVFKDGGKSINIVEMFKCLGRVTAKSDNDEEAVKRNPGRAREKWASMRRFLIQDDARPKTMAVFCRTVVAFPTLWKQVLGADEGSDAPATKLSPTVLPRSCERFCSTRRRRKLDLPEQ
jgi:hypothetical protein